MIASILIIVFYAISLGVSLARYGKQKEGKENFWITLLSASIMIFLMYFSRTFDKLIK